MRPFLMLETARLVGVWAWAEGSLYEVVGGWVPSTVAPAVKVYFDAVSQHHAWRAHLWQQRLPARLVPANADGSYPDVARAPSTSAEKAMQTLSNLVGDAGRLAVYCRVVLVRAVVAYRYWQRRCSPTSDRPVARVLGQALADVVADWQEGSELLVGLLDGPAGAQAAAEVGRLPVEVERLLSGESLA